MENKNTRENTDLIIGRNAVAEALKSERAIDTLLVVRGEKHGSIGRLIAECKDKGIVVKEVDKKKLDFMCGQGNHQGIAAYAAVHEYAEVEDIFALAEERGEDPFIIICDELEEKSFCSPCRAAGGKRYRESQPLPHQESAHRRCAPEGGGLRGEADQL